MVNRKWDIAYIYNFFGSSKNDVELKILLDKMVTNITVLIIIIDDKFHHSLRWLIMLIYSQIFNEASFRDYERIFNDISKQWISWERMKARWVFIFLCRVNLAVWETL